MLNMDDTDYVTIPLGQSRDITKVSDIPKIIFHRIANSNFFISSEGEKIKGQKLEGFPNSYLINYVSRKEANIDPLDDISDLNVRNKAIINYLVVPPEVGEFYTENFLPKIIALGTKYDRIEPAQKMSAFLNYYQSVKTQEAEREEQIRLRKEQKLSIISKGKEKEKLLREAEKALKDTTDEIIELEDEAYEEFKKQERIKYYESLKLSEYKNQKQNSEHNALSYIYDKYSKGYEAFHDFLENRGITDKLQRLEKGIDNFVEKVESIDGTKKALALAIATTLVLDYLQSGVSGETIVGKIARAPVRLINYISEFLPESKMNDYFKDLDGQRIYPNKNINNFYTDEMGPPVPPSTFSDPQRGKGYNAKPEAESSSSIPSQPAEVPSGEQFLINDVTPTTKLAPETISDKALKDLYKALGLKVRPQPTQELGYLERLGREYDPSPIRVINNRLGEIVELENSRDLHTARPHNVMERAQNVFDIPTGWPQSKPHLEPQDIINNMKGKKRRGKKIKGEAGKILGPAMSTKEDTLTQATRLEGRHF